MQKSLSDIHLDLDRMPLQVVKPVFLEPQRLTDLFTEFHTSSGEARMQIAAAIAQAVRLQPHLLLAHLEELIDGMGHDSMPSIRSLAAAMMGSTARYAHVVPLVTPALLELLGDQDAAVRRQALTALTDIGNQHLDWRRQIVASIASLRTDPDAVVRAQAAQATALLGDGKHLVL